MMKMKKEAINKKLEKLAEDVKQQYFILIVNFLLSVIFLSWSIVDIRNETYIWLIFHMIIVFMNIYNVQVGFNILDQYKHHKKFLNGVKSGEIKITEIELDNIFKE